jgi:hypothetical protein
MNNAVFWNAPKCGSYKNSVLQLTVAADVVPSLLILFTLMMAIRSSETSVLTIATRRHLPEDGILHVPLSI